jgi:hypothetical protein
MPLAAAKIFLCLARPSTPRLIRILDSPLWVNVGCGFNRYSFLCTERSFNILGSTTSYDSSRLDSTLAALALFCQQVGTKSTAASQLTSAGKFNPLGGTFVGF